jgi:hypothetical protein
VASSNLIRRINGCSICTGFRSTTLSSLPAAFATVLAAGSVIAALLPIAGLRLLVLSGTATIGLVRHRIDLAHVVAILNHVLAAEAVLAISNLCHNKLLVSPPPRVGLNDKCLETLSMQCQRVQWGLHVQ